MKIGHLFCNSRYLSVKETQRLLSELQRNSVHVTHVIVNQLVKGWVSDEEMPAFDALLSRADPRPEEDALLQKIQASIELTNARGGIQKKYLGELRAFPEVSGPGLTIIELPLLAGEVTGPEAILDFSQKLVGEDYRSTGDDGPKTLEGWTPTEWNVGGKEGAAAAGGGGEAASGGFSIGARVKIDGLAKAAQYNGYTGKVVEFNDSGRIGVEIIFKAARKRLSLKPENLTPDDKPDSKQRGESKHARDSHNKLITWRGLRDCLWLQSEVLRELALRPARWSDYIKQSSSLRQYITALLGPSLTECFRFQWHDGRLAGGSGRD